ncbi:MAG: thioesterase family protein [Melioribacteraceae bacterium]
MKCDIKFQASKNSLLLYETPLTINTYDIDAAGHVNNIVYIRWLEDLRTKLFLNICDFENILKNDYYLVVISTSITYKKQLKLFDSPVGIMILDNIEHGIITLTAQIGSEKQINAYAEQKCVFINLKNSCMLNQELTLKFLNIETKEEFGG